MSTQTSTGHTRSVPAVAVTSDGRRAVSGSEDGTLKVWDAERGIEQHTFTGHTTAIGADSRFGFGKRIATVAVTADGRKVVSGSWDGTIKVWDLLRGDELRTLEGHGDGVYWVTPIGSRAVSASWDRTIKWWDLERGTELRSLSGPEGHVNGVAVRQRGRCAVFALGDRTLEVWDLEQGAKLYTLEGPKAAINALAISGDGRHAVLALDDSTLRLWDLKRGAELRTLTGHAKRLWAAGMTPDGTRAVSVSDDHTVKLWDLRNGKTAATFTGEGGMRSCDVAADGLTIVAGERSGRVHILRLVSRGSLQCAE